MICIKKKEKKQSSSCILR